MSSRRLELSIPPKVGRHQRELKRWLEAKKDGIGGSSAAPAIGLGKYGSRLRLWAEMTGQQGFDLREESERMLWGNLLEQKVLAETARRAGGKLFKAPGMSKAIDERGASDLLGVFRFKEGGQPLYRSKTRPWQHYSIDGLVDVKGRAVLAEAKTTASFLAHRWAEEPPEEVYLQVQHGFAVTGLDMALVGVLIGGQELRVFEVERDEVIVKTLSEREYGFMHYVTKREAPPLETPVHPDTLDVLKRLHPADTGQTIALPGEALALDQEFEALKARRKLDEAREKEIQALFRGWLGDATFGTLPGGEALYSLKTIAKKAEEKPRPAYTYRELRRKALA